MKINMKNLGPGRELVVQGKTVSIAMKDRGQSAVLMTLTIDDIDIEYPNADGSAVDIGKRLEPGTYECALSLAVIRTGVEGATFDSDLSVNGVSIATAKGTLPNDKKVDRGLTGFTLTVT